MGANVSTPQPREEPKDDLFTGHQDASPVWSKHKWVCHCNVDPKPVKKDPRVLDDAERSISQERKPMGCALCPYTAASPCYHCEKCFVLRGKEDPAGDPAKAEVRDKKECQDAEGEYKDNCHNGELCQWCTLSCGQI